MINPQQITKFDRDEAELQEFLLFCVLVQGKNAEMQAVKLECFLTFLAHFTGERLPFKMVNIAMNYELEGDETEAHMLLQAAKQFGLGQYNRLCQAIEDFLLLPPLKEVSLEQLESCFAIGPKSARFFLLHSRPDQKFAVLDVHVLRWLGLKGHKVPKNTPQGKLYGEIEKIFLTYCGDTVQSIADLDLAIWKMKGQLI